MGHYRTLITDPAQPIRELRRRLAAIERRLQGPSGGLGNIEKGTRSLNFNNDTAASDYIYHSFPSAPSLIFLTVESKGGSADYTPVISWYANTSSYVRVLGALPSTSNLNTTYNYLLVE
jgi:hypothetical protein